MTAALRRYCIIPDVILEEPHTTLDVVYPNNLVVDVGRILTPTQVKSPPKVEWDDDPNIYYTLCMIDPDVPTRQFPTQREWNHWLVVNILSGNISSGEVLAQYVGAFPSKETGHHRYVLLLYEQPKKLTFDEKHLTNKSKDGRSNFSIRKFANKYNFGKPIAVNMFQAEYDNYVPVLCKQLGC